MDTNMQAAVFVGPGELRLEPTLVPEPKPGEVRIALEGCGVCASNLPLWQGAPWLRYPLEPGQGGHEGWGRVVALGEGVDRALLGKRVAALSYKAYAECDVARAEDCVVLPDALASVPFPGEALGCAVNIFRRSDIRPGHTLAVIGVGFLGASLVRLAAREGARVIAISRRPHALHTARAMGAHETIEMRDHAEIVERIRALTQGRMCERTLEATGKAWPLDLAAELTGEGGRMVVAGYHQDGPRTVNMQLWNWRGFDVINAHERDPKVSVRGMREAVKLVSEGVLDPSSLYTHYRGLGSLGDALNAAHERPDGFIKALVHVEARS